MMTSDKLRNNTTVTPAQLEVTGSSLNGVSSTLELSIRFAGCRLIQKAGVLLYLRQDVIARAILVFSKFWLGKDGGSLRQWGAADIAAGSLLLTTKLSSEPKSPRTICTVIKYLTASLPRLETENIAIEPIKSLDEHRTRLFEAELVILRTLGFYVHIDTPYIIAINFMQTLEVFQNTNGKMLAKRVFALLNEALLSPQLLLVTHRPNQVAVAAIYLGAKQIGFKLPQVDWWEVFDVNREELGFLVAGMTSFYGWVIHDQERWQGKVVPLTLEDVLHESEKHDTIVHESE